jgi:putative hemolysin
VTSAPDPRRSTPIPPGTLDYPGSPEALPTEEIAAGRYLLRFARTAAELDRLLRLRFEVFNLELGEGLDSAYATGRDEDELDIHFHHLMIESRETDLSGIPAEAMAQSVEIGRACVARPHRNGRVLHLLWRGLATYLSWNRKSHLFGCCSLTSQDPAVGESAYRFLRGKGLEHDRIRTAPLPGLGCDVAEGTSLPEPHIPALFESYLSLGAKICGPPAIDRLFKTIDFLVVLNADELDPRVFRTFFR